MGGMWACGACTLENEAVASACVACETPRPGGGASKAQLQKMADDNSCLFHAVAYCLNISSSPAQVGGSGLGVGLRLLALTLDHRLSPDPAWAAAQLREQIVGSEQKGGDPHVYSSIETCIGCLATQVDAKYSTY